MRPLAVAIALVALGAGCGSEPVLDEHAVAAPSGRVSDLSLLPLPDSEMALAWRESARPNEAEAHAAFLRIGANGLPRGNVVRDDNVSEAASPIVSTGTTILQVLAGRGEHDERGLVAVVRDPDTGERLPDGYRTLPVFAGATLSDLDLVPTVSGALLAWVERGGDDPPADFVQLVALDAEGNPTDAPLALGQLPAEVVEIDLSPWGDGQEAVLAVLARQGGSAQVVLFRFSVDETLRLAAEPRPLGADLSGTDRVLALETLGDCLELLVTEGGVPAHATFDALHLGAELPATSVTALPPVGAPGIAPRLLRSGDSRVVYVYDSADGATHASFIDRGDPAGDEDVCSSRVGAERSFPLSSNRCAVLATAPGDPLRYACAAACMTEGCGDQWIWVGRARL